MELNRNGTLRLKDSLDYLKRHKTLTDIEKSLLIKTMSKVDLLAADTTNAKLMLNSNFETDAQTYILYLSQNDIAFKFLSRKGTMCPFASPECIMTCLGQYGRAELSQDETMVKGARLRKTLYLILFKDEFMAQLDTQIKRLKKKLAKKGKRLAVRLNGTSDVSFKNIILKHTDAQFYDYTAVPKRAIVESQLDNYHVTFSRKENNDSTCLEMLHNGVNVAIPFSKDLYDSIGDVLTYQGETFRVVDGSTHDMRFLDPTDSIGYIVKLKEIKSKNKKIQAQNETLKFIVRDLSEIEFNQLSQLEAA